MKAIIRIRHRDVLGYSFFTIALSASCYTGLVYWLVSLAFGE